MNIEIIRRAYEAIGDKTPMMSDCGALCSAACCFTDEDGQGGVNLLPGEEAQLQNIKVTDGSMHCTVGSGSVSLASTTGRISSPSFKRSSTSCTVRTPLRKSFACSPLRVMM